MRSFKPINATGIEDALAWLRRYENNASIIAGGTDLRGKRN